MALHCTHSSVETSVLYWRAHNWTQDSRGGLTSSEWKGIPEVHFTCTDATTAQGVAVCLSAKRHCWPTLNLTTSTVQTFSQSCFLAPQLQLVLLHRTVPVQMQDCAFADLNFIMFLPAYFSILWRCLWIAALPCSTLATPPIQYHPLICWECSSRSSNLAMKILWQTISKGLLIVKVYNIHCCPLIHRSGKQVGQPWFGKSILIVPSLSLALHMVGNSFQEHLLHKLPRDRGMPSL